MPSDNAFPNDVGAGWTKLNQRGEEYISLSIDVAKLLDLNGGDTGKVSISMFPIDNPTSDRSPNYRLKFYPRDGGRRTPDRRPPAPRSGPARRASTADPDDDLPM